MVEGTVPAVGTPVTAEIDWERRHTLMRTHTALHAGPPASCSASTARR